MVSWVCMEWTQTTMASTDDVLEAFLQDMSALDQQQKSPNEDVSTATKRDVDAIEDDRPPVMAKKRRVPSWLKRKQELETLRQQSEALETRVQFLSSKCVRSTASEAFQVERQQFHDAQKENERLKQQLQTFVNLSGHLQTVLTTAQQQQKELMVMSLAAARTLHIESGAAYQLILASPGVFDMLERRVDARFRELETSLDIEMTTPDTELVQVCYKESDRRVGTVAFTRAQLLPFDTSEISSTIWSIVELGGFPGDGHDSRVIRRSDDVYAMDSRLTMCLQNGGSVNVNAHTVMKRFETSKGVVMLLESSSDWTADVQGSGSWIHTTQECGCFRIQSYSSNASSGVSQLRTELTLKPSNSIKKTSCYPLAEARAVSDIVIPSFRDIIRSRHQFVENALFDCMRERGGE